MPKLMDNDSAMTQVPTGLFLDIFGLPDTFPPFLVPDPARQLINDAKKGMPAADLLQMATDRGFNPLWKPLPHMGDNVYGFGLDINGLQVPLMVRVTSG